MTTRDIQQATLKLAVENGLDAVTTEAIADAAGVSTRTFFNYFPNKESAAIGIPPGFDPADKAALCEGRGALASDIKTFLDKHMTSLAQDDATLRMVRDVIRHNIKANSVLEQFHVAEREELTECLNQRVDDAHIAMALASNAVSCTSRAIHLWEETPGISLTEALDIVWQGQIAAARLLTDAERLAP
jgi:AcrR family transcriptional regulator